MKVYLYFILVFLSDGLAFINAYGRAENSFDLLRILYLEKTSFKDFSFDPFPLLIMLSYTFNIILSVSYVTSNSLKSGNSIVLSRFNSSIHCLFFICIGTFKRVILCSFINSAIPALLSISIIGCCNIGDMLVLIVIFFIRQTVLLSYGTFAALLIGKKLMSAAAEIIGALSILLLVIVDTFMQCALALVDMSANNYIIITIEILVFWALYGLFFSCFRKSKDKLDERL